MNTGEPLPDQIAKAMRTRERLEDVAVDRDLTDEEAAQLAAVLHFLLKVRDQVADTTLADL